MLHNKRIRFLSLLIFLFIGCNYSTPSKLIKAENDDSSGRRCLKILSEFADTLNVDNVGSLSDSDKSKKDILRDCNLKKYRQDFKMQSSIVLVVLKIYNYDLKQGWQDDLANDKANMSNLVMHIIFEYAYLYYGKEKYYAEDLYVNSIIYFIQRNPVFLKNPQIEQQYENSYKNHVKKIKSQHRDTH